MSAKTLEDAYNALDPRQPVKPEQVEDLFVPRPHSPVQKMIRQIRISRERLKILFVGHSGSGKTSELSFLSTRLESDYLPIVIPLYEIYQKPAVSHTELVFAMTLRLLRYATDEKIVPKGLVNETWERWLEEGYHSLKRFFFGEQLPSPEEEKSISLKVSILVAELETKIGTETYTSNQVKEYYEGRVADLLHLIRHISLQMEQKIERKLLLVVEDLDKFDASDTRELFKNHARTLTEPQPSIIYTLPVAMRYTDDFRLMRHNFRVHVLPNFVIKNRDGSVNKEGRAAMWHILQRRVDSGLFAEDVLDNAISLSGGHVRSLIQLAQSAVLNALVDEAETVQLSHLDEARRVLRDDYMVSLKREDIELLRQIHDDEDKDLVNTTPEKQALLFNGSLLEYINTRAPWAAVNPIVEELLDREWH